jgi:hypothetical protein
MVHVDVYNAIGEHVLTLVSSEKDAGSYSVIFDASALPEGVYYYRMQADGYVEMRMMNVLR